jgi:hypothetical protein
MRSDLVPTSSSPDPGVLVGSEQSEAADRTRAMAAGLRAGGAGQLVRLAERLRSHDHAQLCDAVMSATMGVGNATVCVREMNRLVSRLRPEAAGRTGDGPTPYSS